MNNFETICTFAFLILSSIFLLIGANTKRKSYYSISIGIVGLYLAFVISLMNKNGIDLFFVIQHMSALLALMCCYLFVEEENSKRDNILNRMIIGFTFLMMVGIYFRE